MMFVDESGDPGYPKDGNWTKWHGSKVYARLGLIVHGWKWKAWNDRLVSFKFNRGLLWDAEIKASHLRRGQGTFVGWDELRRAQFIKDLSDLIGLNRDLTLIGVAINKTTVDTTQKDRLVKPDVRSLELLLERYNQFLHRQQDKAGIVVLDPTKDTSDDNLRYFQSFLQTQSPNLKPLHIVEGTFFAKSHTSNMIQLADFCCNVFFREVTRDDQSAEWKAIRPRFWRVDGRVLGNGIKHWPS
ncbi:MAG: DUF3800 domain-containing protein [Verrucomicrobia bacterium]|nr:DUF3800 domain-containing protein [Verrucomicrobiota bacterium]